MEEAERPAEPALEGSPIIRAVSLPSWPIDEGTLRFTVVVITGVVTSLVVRGLFASVGF